MSQIAELAVLQRQVKDLEDSIKTIERGLSKKELRLRDEFAMAAMQGVQANPCDEACRMGFVEVAEFAYEFADAMLAVRGEK